MNDYEIIVNEIVTSYVRGIREILESKLNGYIDADYTDYDQLYVIIQNNGVELTYVKDNLVWYIVNGEKRDRIVNDIMRQWKRKVRSKFFK